MAHADHANFALRDEIEDLVAEGLLDRESTGRAIAEQVIRRGPGSLSAAQQVIWDAHLAPLLMRRRQQRESQRRTWHRSIMTLRRPAEPRVQLLEPCWRVVAPGHQVLECGIYQTDAGLEVREVRNASGVNRVRRERAAFIGSARMIAAAWHTAAIEQGFVNVSERHGELMRSSSCM